MSIQPPNGILDITGATLRVSKMEFSNVTGFDTVLNNVARNTVLHVDTTEYTANVAYAVKPPNMFMAQFDLELAAGGTGLPCNFNYYNDSNLGTSFNGYNLSFNDTSIILTYDGGSALHTATLSSSLNNGVYRKVKVLFDRDTTLVSINGENVFRFKDELRPRTYDTGTTGYIRWWHNSPVARKIKNLKVSNGEKWAQEYDSAGLSSNISYTHGLVGVGTSVPEYTLDVAGDIRASGNLIINGSNTLINTTSLAIEDGVIECGKGNSSAAKDLGFLMVRNDGSSTTNSNVAMFWDESTDALTFGFSDSGPTATTLTPNTTKTLNSYFAGNVGIGVVTPNTTFHVVNPNATNPPWYNASYLNDSACMMVSENNYNVESARGPNTHYTTLILSSDHAYDSGNNAAGSVSFAAKNEFGGYSAQYGQISGVRLDNFYGGLSFATMHNLNDGKLREDMRITNGNVGIGTAGPKTLTHIGKLSANSGTHTTIPSSNMGVSASFPDSTNLWLGKHSSAQAEDYWGMALGVLYNGNSYIQTLDKSNSSYYNLLLQPNGGNVGIGTVNPKQMFEVDSSGYGLFSGRLGVGNVLTSAQNGGGQNHWDHGTAAKLLVRCANSANPTATYANARTYAGIALVPGFDAADTTNMGLWGTNSGENPVFYIQNQVNNGQNGGGYISLQPVGGNVGIGLTGPESKLHIYGSDNPLMLQSQRSPYPKLSYDFSGSNAENFQFYDHHGSGRGFLYGRKYTTGTNPNANAGWHFYGNDNTLALRIDGSANVGIGTDNPGVKLHVHSGGSNTTIRAQAPDNYAAILSAQGDSQGTGRLYVGQSGSYGGGIEYNGDNSPASTGAGADYITLYRNVNNSMFWTAKNSYGDGNWIHAEKLSWSGQTYWDTNITLQAPNATYYQARCTGWNTYSARYLKENIEPSLNCLDKVKALKAVNYTWKAGYGDNVAPKEEYEHTHLLTGPQTHMGFIADEVAEVMPEVCTFDPDGTASGLDYSRITPVLVNAVKELDEKIGKGENSSDDRLKDNETYVRNATASIMKLKPQVYDKRESFSSNIYTREAGLIAQDIWYDAPELRFVVKPGLMSQIPEEAPLRSNDPRVDPDYSKWGPNPASVEYNNLIPYAIKSIQELSTELPRCKTQITGVTPANVDGHRGLIVSAKTGEMHLGAPVLSLSTEAKDKKCFGVISYSNTYSTDNEFLVDATGCGQVWVSNSSPIESGDYLTSSSVTGYAMKQDDDLLHNYTIGKALRDCDFNPTQKPKRRVVQKLSTVTHYIKTTLYPITEERYNELDDPYRFSEEHAFYKKTENIKVPEKNGYDNVEYLRKNNDENIRDNIATTLSSEQWTALDSDTQTRYYASYSNVVSLGRVSLDDYTKLDESERGGLTLSSETWFYYKSRKESMNALPGYEEETRNEYIDVLDEHGQIQWEDDPSGATEPAYEIRYLTSDGQITDESNAVYTAALVACTYHCG